MHYIIISIIIVTLIILLYLYTLAIKKGGNNANEEVSLPEDTIYKQLHAMILSGKHAVAQKVAKKYLKVHKDYHRVRMLLARSFYDNGYFYDAIEHLEELNKNFSNKTDLSTMLATAYRKVGQNSSAISTYLTLLKYDDKNLTILKELAELYYVTNQKKSSIGMYQKLLTLNPNEGAVVEYNLRIATIYRELLENNNAIEFAKAALEANPNETNVLTLLKDLYNLTMQYSKSIEIVKKLITLLPDDIFLKMELINFHYKNKDYDEALDLAKKILDTTETNTSSIQNTVAKIYIETNRLEEGLEILEEILRLNSKAYFVAETLAFAYEQLKNYPKAIEIYNKLIETTDIAAAESYKNHLGNLYCNWAEYLYLEGNSKDAFKKIEDALVLDNTNSRIYYVIGKINFLSKNYGDAIKQLQKAINLTPTEVTYYTLLANLYEETENFYDAKNMYEEAINVNENTAIAHMKLGIITLKQRDFSTAFKHLNKAVELEPQNENFIYHLALACEAINEVNKAMLLYNKVLEINPGHKEAQINLNMLKSS